MKALFLEKVGEPIVLRDDLPDPVVRPGAAIVRILAVPVLSYAKQVHAGKQGYLLPTPFIPGNGGVGVIEQVADDVPNLKPGQHVAIDPRMVTHTAEGPDEADSVLIGLTALSESARKLQSVWRNGTFAEKALVPAESLTPVEAITAENLEAFASLGHLAVPYGGLLRGQLEPGQSVVINGATGAFGARSVLVALAMGADRVIAVGRNPQALAPLTTIDPKRVRSAVLDPKNVQEITSRILEANGGRPAHLYYDMLGRADEPSSILGCLGAVRYRGTAVWMGGAGIDVPLSYRELMRRELTLIGNFMYPRFAISRLAAMLRAGTLQAGRLKFQRFKLDQFSAAFDAAEQSKGLEGVLLVMGKV